MLHNQNQVRPTTDTITDTAADTVVASVESVSKSFGDTVALDDLSMQVHAGESLGLLGPNGAGKSTLISLLTGTRRANTGTVTIFGGDPTSPDSRRRLGVTPQATALPVTLRVREVFAFVGAHFGTTQEHLDELAASFDLADLLEKQCGSLSGGQQRRLMVALALVGDPELRHPRRADDRARRRVPRPPLGAAASLSRRGRHSRHHQSLPRRDRGPRLPRARRRPRPGHRRRHRPSDHRAGPAPWILLRTTAPEQQLLALPGTVSVTPESESDPHHVVLASRDADATVRALVADGIDFSDLQVHGASLEEAFLALTTHQSPAHAA